MLFTDGACLGPLIVLFHRGNYSIEIDVMLSFRESSRSTHNVFLFSFCVSFAHASLIKLRASFIRYLSKPVLNVYTLNYENDNYE